LRGTLFPWSGKGLTLNVRTKIPDMGFMPTLQAGPTPMPQICHVRRLSGPRGAAGDVAIIAGWGAPV
jgi:hypothetical protein